SGGQDQRPRSHLRLVVLRTSDQGGVPPARPSRRHRSDTARCRVAHRATPPAASTPGPLRRGLRPGAGELSRVADRDPRLRRPRSRPRQAGARVDDRRRHADERPAGHGCRRHHHGPDRHSPRRPHRPRPVGGVRRVATATVTYPEASERRRQQRAWYFYDWANSAYVTTVLTVLFSPYLASVAETAACGAPGTPERPCTQMLRIVG